MNVVKEMICASCGGMTESDPCVVCDDQATLNGEYQLLECLGRGGFGTTYLAEGPDGVRVAVKELPYHLAASPKARELLFREIRILRELDHQAIPKYLADFSTGRGRHRVHCLVQEYVEGHTLAHEMENHRYSPAEVLDVLDKLLPILTYLHSLSPPVIHRDIKPANIIRRRDGSLALVDFGSVRDVLATTLGGSTVIGTFGYMAPEQFRGDAVPQTDLHALGALAVALLTRKEPAAVLDEQNRITWRRFTDVHPALGELVDDLLAPEVAQRPATAVEGAKRVALVADLITEPAYADPRPFEPEPFEEPIATVPQGGRS
ncbi:MAG: serine/threonine protein kinase, partial [Proteobacteria bacterium]|nr:serine/threonine protein kinase [Pseudomonadota bacterium]